MKVLYQTSTNSLRQKEQAPVKDGWQKIGIETELKSVDAGVFFASDPGLVDTINKMPWDTGMWTSTFGSPYPQAYMKQWYSGDQARDIAQKSNNWGGGNRNRWVSDEFNKLYDQTLRELDPEKSKAMWHKLNDMVVSEFVNVPLIDRKSVGAYNKRIKGPGIVPFDSDPWNIGDWAPA